MILAKKNMLLFFLNPLFLGGYDMRNISYFKEGDLSTW